MRALTFIGFVIGSIILTMVPILHWPFSWLQTYFHEISHGLAAVLTGGVIDRIELHLNGAGVCYYRGGWRGPVAFAGYVGAVLWGALIYLASTTLEKSARWIGLFMVGMIVISAVLWGRDLLTLIIMLVMAAALFTAIRFENKTPIRLFLQFTGIYILVDAIRSPLNLVDGRHIGDGATLANLTGLPEIVWVATWELFALWILWVLWRTSLSDAKTGSAVV